MTVDLLADGLTAYRLGSTVGALVFPVAGLLVLIVGIRRRRAYDRWNMDDDRRLLGHSDQDPDAGFVSQPRSRGTGFLITAAVLLVLGTGHVLAATAELGARSAPDDARVGTCISAEAFEQRDIGAGSVDCGQANATLQVASVGDGTATCPDGKRGDSVYLALSDDVRTLCYVPNLREGQCYRIVRAATPVNCIAPTANAKVTKRVDDSSEASVCDDGATVAAYPDPPRVFCLVRP